MNTEEIYKLKKVSSDFYKKQHHCEALNSYNELIKQYSGNGKESEKSTELCKATHRQAVCHFMLNNYDKAMESLKRCEEIYNKNNIQNENLLARNTAYKAYCCVKNAKSESEMQYGFEMAAKAKEIFEKNKITDDDENAVLFSTLGMYHFKKGENELAKKELERAEHFIKKHQHKKNMVNMIDLFYLAQIYLKEGRIEDAINKFTESHNLAEDLGLGDNDYHVTCLENISNLYYKLERDDVAQKFEKKLQEYKQCKQ
jgi:tetratricopeptide (TPR) repeat protein